MNNLILKALALTDYQNNPYFVALKKREFEKSDFIQTQEHFYHAVNFFNRPMAVVAAKIPEQKLRLQILKNVWEEHGEGDVSKFHQATFKELLRRLGSDRDVDDMSLSPHVRLFNTTLTGASVMDDFAVAVGVFGIIERMFVDISNMIGHAIVDNGWLESDQVIHYSLHKELDVRHSKDFFDILESFYGEKRYEIEQGIMMGAVMFINLYTGLYHDRKIR